MNILRAFSKQFPAFFVLLALASHVHAQDNNALLRKQKTLSLSLMNRVLWKNINKLLPRIDPAYLR